MISFKNIKFASPTWQYSLLVVSAIAIFFPDLQFFFYLGLIPFLWTFNSNVKIQWKWSFIFLFLYVFWGYLTLFYSENLRVGVHYIGKGLPLLLVSIIGIFSQAKSIDLKRVENAYLWGVFSFLLVAGAIFVYDYYYGVIVGRINVYGRFQIDIFDPIMHRTYASAMLIMSFPFLFKRLFYNHRRVESLMSLFLIIIILFFVFLSGARMALSTALLISVLLCLYYSAQRFSKSLLWIILGGVILLVGLIFISSPRVRKNLWLYQQGISLNTVDARAVTWQTALQLIGSQPLWGVGVGDAQDEMNRVYHENNHDLEANRELNVHNQYLQTWLERGAIGLLLLVCFFLSLIFTIDKRFRIYAFTFVLIYGFTFVSESMLLRNFAVFPIAFWLLVFDFTTPRTTANNNGVKKTSFFIQTVVLFFLFLFIAFLLFRNVDFETTSPRTYMTTSYKLVSFAEMPNRDKLPMATEGLMIDKSNLSLRHDNDGRFMAFDICQTANKQPLTVDYNVWCFISEDCNVSCVSAYIYNKGFVSKVSSYDLTAKGTWQVLNVKADDVVQFTNMGARIDMLDGNLMTGSVIFTLPNFNY